MQALVAAEFREKAERRAQLSADDNPETFAVLRLFLYHCSIRLNNVSLEAIERLLH